MTESPLPPVKLLLVDDLEENLMMLEALLQSDGVELLMATSGPRGLALLQEHDVALALLDVQMPEMDGFELAELMRGSERGRQVPIIFVTAGSRDMHRVFRGYDAGAVDFLFKPIEPRILKHKVETFCELYRQKQQLARQLEQLRASEEERAKVNAELAETLRLNETFVAAVGHDLRSPLGAMLTGSEMILRSTHEASTRQVAEQMRASGKRMARMVDDLFDLARARLGSGIPLVRSTVDLLEIARKVLAELEPTAQGRPLSLESQGDLKGEWDGGRLAQVLSNLVGNAIRHGAPKAAIKIRLEGASKRADVKASVHNEGVIPAETLARLFEPFKPSADRRKKAEGLGLGLYIVQQLVKAHGGSIHVRSSADHGTTFEVSLPRR